MKHIGVFLLLLAFIIPQLVNSQELEGRLIGKVKDTSKVPVSFATISLYQPDRLKEAVKTTHTDIKGAFEIKVDTGTYVLTISYTGFINISRPVYIKSGDNIIDEIILPAKVGTLQNVTVTARRPLIEQGADKIIYNVEDDPAAKAESASDILRKVPLVTVDGEGNVQVNGQTNFRILLNGLETSMFAMNVKDALRNFPGAVISKIEVITAPSAKYDAEGVGGLINIITKKKIIGYNAYLSSYYSTLSNYSESASFNIKTGKMGVSGYFGTSGSLQNISSRYISETTPFVNTAFSKRTLNGDREGKNIGGNANLEITYEIDSFNIVAAYGSMGRYKGTSVLNQAINIDYALQPSEAGFFFQDNTSFNPNKGMGADLIRKFRGKPEKELTFRFNGQFSRNEGIINSLQDNAHQDRYVLNNSIAINRELTFQSDFVQPNKEKQKLELGVKAILRKASSKYESKIRYGINDEYKLNPLNSDLFNYHQEVYSIYTSHQFSMGKYNFRSGLRAEHTIVNGDFVSSKTSVNQQYTNLVPNVLLSRKFTSLYTLTASYNIRLQRPYITSLNPFINNNDSLNISYGNPDLGPQVLHAISFQNRFTKGKLFAAIILNGSYTNNLIVQYARFEPGTGVTTTTSANFGRESQISLGSNLNTSLGQKLNVGFSTQLRYNKIENKSILLQQREGFSGQAFGFFNYKVVSKFTISGSGGGLRNPYTLVNSPSAQYFYQVNFGYKFFKEKLSVTMNVNNFHDKLMYFDTVTDNSDFRIVNTHITPYRVIYFGATYSFGKLKESISKKKGVSNDDLLQ